eukprot:scaffold42617_cov19-Prasinocladus_malaysianus.AAC.1
MNCLTQGVPIYMKSSMTTEGPACRNLASSRLPSPRYLDNCCRYLDSCMGCFKVSPLARHSACTRTRDQARGAAGGWPSAS